MKVYSLRYSSHCIYLFIDNQEDAEADLRTSRLRVRPAKPTSADVKKSPRQTSAHKKRAISRPKRASSRPKRASSRRKATKIQAVEEKGVGDEVKVSKVAHFHICQSLTLGIGFSPCHMGLR